LTSPSLRQAALTGARWTMAAKVGMQLVTWPITIIVMRLLEPGDYGLFAIALLFSGFIVLFSELGFAVALVQAREVDDRMQRAAATMVLVLNGAVAALICLLAPWVARLYQEPGVTLVMQLLTLELLLAAPAVVPRAMLERELEFRSISLAQMIAGAAGAATTLAAAWLGGGVLALVAGILVTALVRTAMTLWFYGRMVWPGRASLASVRPLVHVSSQVVIGRVLWYWYGQADQLVLGRLLHAVQLGYYSVAAQLAMLPAGKAMEAVNRVVFPIFSRSAGQADTLRDMHRRTSSLLALYGFGVCWGLAAVAQEFTALVLGEKWMMAATPLTLLSVVAPLRMLCSLNNSTTTAVGRPEAATWELAIASVMIPLAVTAGAIWNGLLGASLAWLLAFPMVFIVSNALTCKAISQPVRQGLWPLLAPIGAGAMMFGAVALTREFAADQLHVGVLLALEILVGAATYLAVMALAARDVLSEARAFALDLLRWRKA
jgi:teichuronic acid exporter